MPKRKRTIAQTDSILRADICVRKVVSSDNKAPDSKHAPVLQEFEYEIVWNNGAEIAPTTTTEPAHKKQVKSTPNSLDRQPTIDQAFLAAAIATLDTVVRSFHGAFGGELRIVSNSTYLHNVLGPCAWLNKWQRNGWKTVRSGAPVQHEAQLRLLHRQTRGIRIVSLLEQGKNDRILR